MYQNHIRRIELRLVVGMVFSFFRCDLSAVGLCIYSCVYCGTNVIRDDTGHAIGHGVRFQVDRETANRVAIISCYLQMDGPHTTHQ